MDWRERGKWRILNLYRCGPHSDCEDIRDRPVVDWSICVEKQSVKVDLFWRDKS